MEQATFLKINPADSVVVCLAPKKKGDIIEVDGKQITVKILQLVTKYLSKTYRKVRISSSTVIPLVTPVRP